MERIEALFMFISHQMAPKTRMTTASQANMLIRAYEQVSFHWRRRNGRSPLFIIIYFLSWLNLLALSSSLRQSMVDMKPSDLERFYHKLFSGRGKASPPNGTSSANRTLDYRILLRLRSLACRIKRVTPAMSQR